MDSSHQHTALRGKDLEEAARNAVLAAGEQWTPMRAGVFGVLTGFEKPASAYDVAEAMTKSEGRRIAANSVYRILDLFVAANVAQRIESENAYIANAHPECRHDCIFLICDACGETQHVDDDMISEGVRQAAGRMGFLAARPVIEVRGTCSRCAVH
ncbi:Fur family transcriptional regulator [Novosphingobium sp. 9U]|uniref:Fur family transcriptional regulator n=1 Tax=Novosphingobium sp. 9U TaxID=2653158 RepID=UPI0012F089DE|nr:transcriptional repressor [Novosphingobium sp. 9U]VWX54236.1 Zinc uptake regulation protein ZUR [Novosphingobium sp. 9U]